jgi:hypothetical protein
MTNDPLWSNAMSSRSSGPAPISTGRRRVAGLTLIAGALVAVLAACGGGSTTPATAPSSGAAGSGGAGGAGAPPGAFGTAAAVSPSSLEVQNPSTGQVTVNFTASTRFTNSITAALADVTVGECVAVGGSSAGAGGVTARTVTITQAGPNGCGTTGGGFGGGRTRSGGAPPTRGSGSGGNGGNGGNPANTARAVGSVAAVNGSTFTVHGSGRPAGSTSAAPATDTTVTVTGSTTFTKTISATSSVLAVGDCIAAIGPTDDTGAVTATSISVSQPGPKGCALGFGGGRRQGGAGGTING